MYLATNTKKKNSVIHAPTVDILSSVCQSLNALSAVSYSSHLNRQPTPRNTMKSPVDPNTSLIQREIEPGLIAYTCPKSGGIWIDHKHYWDWLLKQPGFPKPTPAISNMPVAIEDPHNRPLISPESGRLMIKYRVGNALNFRIDHDSISGGFWLDKGEYDLIRERNLHDELHLICSPEYQQVLAKLDAEAVFDQRIRDILGPDRCALIRDLASTIENQEIESVAIAYLNQCIDSESRNPKD